MNLALDLGNTRLKAGVFKRHHLIQSFFLDYQKINDFDTMIDISVIDKIAITTVKNLPESLSNLLNQWNKSVLIVDANTPLPIKLKYDTPNTLGSDRICNAIAGSTIFPNQNVLIIDLGTCNKYDFVDEYGNYLGGSITAGFKMRLDAMHEFTANLPLVKTEQTDDFIGKSTKTSMETGTYWGVVGEINEFVRQYHSRFNDTKVVATGGYLSYFEKVLKNFIFADPNLTLKGLNSILNFQKD